MLVREAKEKTVAKVPRSNTRSNVKLAKPQIFNKNTRFLIVCKLYIKMKIRNVIVEKQIQSYIWRESADI